LVYPKREFHQRIHIPFDYWVRFCKTKIFAKVFTHEKSIFVFTPPTIFYSHFHFCRVLEYFFILFWSLKTTQYLMQILSIRPKYFHKLMHSIYRFAWKIQAEIVVKENSQILLLFYVFPYIIIILMKLTITQNTEKPLPQIQKMVVCILNEFEHFFYFFYWELQLKIFIDSTLALRSFILFHFLYDEIHIRVVSKNISDTFKSFH